MRTPSRSAITFFAVLLAATAAGCSSHRSTSRIVPSGSQATAASTQLNSSAASAGPASPVNSAPVNPAGGSPSAGSAPPASPSASPSASSTRSSTPSPPPPTTASGVPPPGAHAVTVVAGLACPAAGSAGQATSPAPKPLPPSLAITAVVRCETVQRSYPGLGSWSVQLAEVADSGLGPFLADLRAPSDARPSGIMCPDFRILVPWFELVDSAGAALNAAIPTDQCGAPKTAAITALQALHFRVTD